MTSNDPSLMVLDKMDTLYKICPRPRPINHRARLCISTTSLPGLIFATYTCLHYVWKFHLLVKHERGHRSSWSIVQFFGDVMNPFQQMRSDAFLCLGETRLSDHWLQHYPTCWQVPWNRPVLEALSFTQQYIIQASKSTSKFAMGRLVTHKESFFLTVSGVTT